jgi:hypothetical protein
MCELTSHGPIDVRIVRVNASECVPHSGQLIAHVLIVFLCSSGVFCIRT